MADDIRARRAERARQEKVKGLPKQLARYGVYALVALVVIGAVGWAATHQPPPKKLVHEHAAFGWFVEGQPVSFRNSAYDFAKFGDVVHMHIGGPESDQNDVLHVEGSYIGGVPDWNLAKIFAQYGLKAGADRVTLDTLDGHNGTTWSNAGNHTWHALLSKATVDGRKAFAPIQGDWTTYIPRDEDKILLTYGDLSDAQLAQQESSIPNAIEWGANPPKMAS